MVQERVHPFMVGKACQQEYKAVVHITSAVRKQRVEEKEWMGYTAFSRAPNVMFPPVWLHLLNILQPSKAAASAGDPVLVLEHMSLWGDMSHIHSNSPLIQWYRDHSLPLKEGHFHWLKYYDDIVLCFARFWCSSSWFTVNMWYFKIFLSPLLKLSILSTCSVYSSHYLVHFPWGIRKFHNKT